MLPGFLQLGSTPEEMGNELEIKCVSYNDFAMHAGIACLHFACWDSLSGFTLACWDSISGISGL